MQVGRWYNIPGKASSEEFKDPSKRLVDLVRMSISAHRVKHGDIVWACWQPGGAGAKIKDIYRVNSGAMLIMLNPRGADAIAAQIARAAVSHKSMPLQPWHFDLALKAWLANKHVNKEHRACYIFPPVGNYVQHVSGCDEKRFGPGTAGRPSCWNESWSCRGTTVSEDPQRRETRFLRWDGDHGHIDIGSANVDEELAGKT